MTPPYLDIEHELFTLFRRTFAVHVRTSTGDYEIDRSTYGILLLLADEGPTRLGHIATAYRLDPSTITRQVQSVVSQGLAEKHPDAEDRRATILTITAAGLETLTAVRTQRAELIGLIMDDWSDRQRHDFLRALRRVNTALAGILEARPAPA